MKSAQWLLEDEHWLEALRLASHAKVQVMHQIVCEVVEFISCELHIIPLLRP